MPEVTNKEEEGKDELRRGKPLTDVHEVHRVGLSDDASNRVDRRVRSVGHVFSGAANLPRLNIVLKFVDA